MSSFIKKHKLLTSLLTLRCTADLWRRREAWPSWSMLLSGVMGSSKIQKHHLVPNNFLFIIYI